VTKQSDWIDYSTPPDARNLQTEPGEETVTIPREPKGLWRAGLPATLSMWVLSIGLSIASANSVNGGPFGATISERSLLIVSTASISFLTAILTVVNVDEARRIRSLHCSSGGLQFTSAGILGRKNRVWMRDEIQQLRIDQQVHHTQPDLLLIDAAGRRIVVVSDLPYEELVLVERSLRTLLKLPPEEKR
jgi:hypothetical protein